LPPSIWGWPGVAAGAAPSGVCASDALVSPPTPNTAPAAAINDPAERAVRRDILVNNGLVKPHLQIVLIRI
jgi:hypothetical protein